MFWLIPLLLMLIVVMLATPPEEREAKLRGIMKGWLTICILGGIAIGVATLLWWRAEEIAREKETAQDEPIAAPVVTVAKAPDPAEQQRALAAKEETQRQERLREIASKYGVR